MVFTAYHIRKFIAGGEVSFNQSLLGILGIPKPVPQGLSPGIARSCVRLYQ